MTKTAAPRKCPFRNASVCSALTPTRPNGRQGRGAAVSKAYDGMIMDTEFCIDSKGMLWFVQAPPRNTLE